MIRFTNIGADSDSYGFDSRGRMARVAGTDRRWSSGSSTMSRSVSDRIDATIYGFRYCGDDRQRRAAENMTKDSYDIAEIVEILNEFKVDMKLPGGSPRPLVSILLDVVRMYTQKAQDQMEFQKRVEQRIKQYVIAHSNVTSEEYDSKLRVEWYLFADEAKEKGFCDHILGVDCDMDEIV